jgi:putative transposase
MDELAGRHANHLGAALRYVSLNPVRARLCDRATDWPWSSVHAHLGQETNDRMTEVAPVRERFVDFAALLAGGEEEALSMRLRKAESIGRPLGSESFLAALETSSDRILAPAMRGRKPKGAAAP